MQTEYIAELLLSGGIDSELNTWEGVFSVHAESTLKLLSALNFIEVTSYRHTAFKKHNHKDGNLLF